MVLELTDHLINKPNTATKGIQMETSDSSIFIFMGVYFP